MTSPTKVNTGNSRPVTQYLVLNAEDSNVERAQLNRILKELNTRLETAESDIVSISGSIGADEDTGYDFNVNQFTIDAGVVSISTMGVTASEINFSTFDTDNISEGSTNLYFTDERAQDAVGGILANSSNITLSYADGTPSITADLVNTAVTPGSYGSASAVGTFTVDANGRLTAAANQSISITSSAVTDFTEAAQDAVGAMVNATLTYTDATPLLGINLGNANTWTATQTFTNLVVNDNTTLGSSNADTINVVGRFSSSLDPATDNTYDLGRVGHEWRDLYIDGTANIDSLVADTADINGGTVDSTAIGSTTPSTVACTTLNATGDATIGSATSNNHTINGFIDTRPPAGLMLRMIETASGSTRRIQFSNSGTTNTIESTAGAGSTELALTVDGTERIRASSAGAAVTGTVSSTVYLVANLPTGSQGMRSFVSDANATTFASVVAGGGANPVPVYHDGTNWRIG